MAVIRRKDNKGRVLKEGEYQRPNGTYHYVYRDSVNKKHSLYAKTLELLREKEKTVSRDVLDGIRPDGNKLTIDDFFERWRSCRETDVKADLLRDSTFSNYVYMYRQFASPIIGSLRIKDITSLQIEAFYKTLVTERGLKLNSIDVVHIVLFQIFEIAKTEHYLRDNPADKMMYKLKAAYRKKEKGKKPDEKALTVEQQTLFLSYISGHETFSKWHNIFNVMLHTGLRVGEITGLRWCDIDFEHNLISVNHTLVYYCCGGSREKKCKYAINDTKTPASKRNIPMLPTVRQALLNERQRQESGDVTCRMEVDGHTDFVFLNRFGDCLNQGVLNKVLRRIIRDCNFAQLDSATDGKEPVLLPAFSCHWLRHTFSTRLIENNVSVKAAQALLGHVDPSTTLGIYTAAQEDFVASELVKIARSLTKQAYESYE